MTLVVLAGRELALFNELCMRASFGDRCPIAANFVAKKLSVNLKPLALKGVIRVEIYAKNWRVVEILVGSHKGQRTQEPPWGGKFYKKMDKNGTMLIEGYKADVSAEQDAEFGKLTAEDLEIIKEMEGILGLD